MTAERKMVKLIAIVEKNFGLSFNGEIPWSFEEDRKFFHESTENSVVIMGRNTFFSHENFPLKNRINCVITKNKIPNIECFESLEDALKKYPDCWIIGGEKLYNYALEKNLADEIIITQVNQEYDADTFLNCEYLKKFKRELIKKGNNFCIWN